MKQINTVALIGLGAIGGYLAEGLYKALGDNLRIVADSKRAERLKRDGLIINGKAFRNFRVVLPEEQTGPADLVIAITKMNQLKSALLELRNQVGENTVIMTPLNGVESETVAGELYGMDKVLYSLGRISVLRTGNALSFDPQSSHMEFGEADNTVISERVQAVAELFKKSGISYTIPGDMRLAIWEKYVCNCSENQILAILGTPIYTWQVSTFANELRIKTAREVIAVARACGVQIDDDYPIRHMERLKTLPIRNKPSTLQDIENGRKTEVDMFAGTVVRLGKQYGVPTPMNEFLYGAIHALEEKNEGKMNP